MSPKVYVAAPHNYHIRQFVLANRLPADQVVGMTRPEHYRGRKGITIYYIEGTRLDVGTLRELRLLEDYSGCTVIQVDARQVVEGLL